MSHAADDQLINEWFAQVKRDDEAKRRLAAAIRAKNKSALEAAVKWVLEHLMRPAAKVARDVLVEGLLKRIGDLL